MGSRGSLLCPRVLLDTIWRAVVTCPYAVGQRTLKFRMSLYIVRLMLVFDQDHIGPIHNPATRGARHFASV